MSWHFEFIWIYISSSSFAAWFFLAKDTLSMIIAGVMSVLGAFYLYYKTREQRAKAIKAEKEINGK